MTGKKKEEVLVAEGVQAIEVAEPIKQEMTSNQEKANAMVIASDEDYDEALKFVASVKSYGKNVDEKRKFFTAPLNAQVDNINALFQPSIKEAKKIEDIVKAKMGTYFEEKEAKQRAIEERAQKTRDAANAKREEQGKELIETPINTGQEVVKTNVVGGSSATVRKVWTGEITDINALPENIVQAILNEAEKKGIATSVVNKFVKAGIREMEGVKIYEKSQISVKA